MDKEKKMDTVDLINGKEHVKYEGRVVCLYVCERDFFIKKNYSLLVRFEIVDSPIDQFLKIFYVACQ